MVRKSSGVYFRILLKFTSFYDGVTFLFPLLPTEAQKNLVGMFYIRQKKKMSPKLEHLVVNLVVGYHLMLHNYNKLCLVRLKSRQTPRSQTSFCLLTYNVSICLATEAGNGYSSSPCTF